VLTKVVREKVLSFKPDCVLTGHGPRPEGTAFLEDLHIMHTLAIILGTVLFLIGTPATSQDTRTLAAARLTQVGRLSTEVANWVSHGDFLAMGWVAVKMQQAETQREAVRAICAAGAFVEYAECFDGDGNAIVNAPLWPRWLRTWLGRDWLGSVVDVCFFGRIDHVGPDVDAELSRAMPHLRRLTKLQGLGFTGCRFSDAGLKRLDGFRQLRMLAVNSTSITDAGMANIKGMTGLQRLYLSHTRVTDAGLKHLRGLRDLRVLYLDSTDITDVGLEHLKGLGQLQKLTLDRTKLTGSGLRHLKGLSQLRNLTLAHTKVTAEFISELQQALPDCVIEYH
jgi:hypothetical protein